MPLSAYVDTILNVDKDVYFGQNMYLRFMVGPHTMIGFRNTSATVPVTGIADINGNVTFSNMVLWLAVKTNELVKNTIMDKFARGDLKLAIPVLYNYSVFTNSTLQNVVWNLTRDMGSTLKYILYTIWNGDAQRNTAYDGSNFKGSKIGNYQTLLNNQPLQNERLDCTFLVNTDYDYNKPHIEKSIINNLLRYTLDWFHMDKFSRDDLPEGHDLYDLSDGLDMTQFAQQLQWSIQSSVATAANRQHNIYACFLRMISIRPDTGITWLA
jgi:hypothetical protein